MRTLLQTALVAVIAAACRTATPGPGPTGAVGPTPAAAAPAVRADDVRAHLSALAADSMEGRLAGAAGAVRAAHYVARQFRDAGLEPAGDSGFFQRVPFRRGDGERTPPLMVLRDWAAYDSLPADQLAVDVNVVGILPGSDPAVGDEYVFVGAHHDHEGVGRPVDGDSIYNGADDDASGVVAVIEVARALARGPRPRRAVVFASLTAEEMGMQGTRWLVAHPPRPLESMVAGLFIEMIGRPDSLAGGAGRLWLTGFERSTMGERLRAAGVPVVPDPRPAMSFFTRSDNIIFARRGVPAHALSSYNMHQDYHQPSDEVERIDVAHMTRAVEAAARAVRVLADGPPVEWKPGGRPAP